MRNRSLILGAGLATASLSLTSARLPAQEVEGLQAGLSLGAGVVSDDDGTRARSDLGFTLASATRSQSFGVTLRGGFEYPDASDEIALVDPTIGFVYNRIGRNAELTAEAAFQRSEVGTLDLEETPNSGELLVDTGTRTTTDLGLQLVFGTVSPVGGEVGLGWKRVDYADIGAATLFPYETRSAATLLRFTVDPRIDLRATGEYEETSAEGTTLDHRTWTAGIGADVELSKVLQASATLSYTEIETTTASATTRESGPAARLDLVRAMPDGSYRLELASTVTDNGTRYRALVERTQDLRLGDLAWSVGATRGGTGDVDALLGLEYSRPSKRGQISVSIHRLIQADAFGEEARVDRARIAYLHSLSELARIETGIAYRSTDYFTPGTESVEQFDLGISYRHQLSPEADLVASFAHTLNRSESRGDESENSFYLGFQRNFSWRP